MQNHVEIMSESRFKSRNNAFYEICNFGPNQSSPGREVLVSKAGFHSCFSEITPFFEISKFIIPDQM